MKRTSEICKALLIAFTIVILAVHSQVLAAPTLTDPHFSITLVAAGLGAGTAMAINNQGNIFVNDYHDTGIGRIHLFRPDGSRSEIITNLLFQDGIAVLSDGNLLIATDDIYHVTLGGVVTLFLTGLSFPGHFEPDGLGNFYFPEAGRGKILILHPDKSLETFASGLNNPNTITFDDQGHIWVAEHSLGEVIELDGQGQEVRRVSGFSQFGPVGLEFWNGSIFMTNPLDASIFRIEKDGTWQVFAAGFTGKANPPSIGPHGLLAVGNSLYVSDGDNLWRIQPVAVPFEDFSADVEFRLGPMMHDDQFEVKTHFTLSAGSNGVDPLVEAVTLHVGTLSLTIPAGSFKQDGQGRFRFEGMIGNIVMEAVIVTVNKNRFEFKGKGAGAHLDGTVLPVTVGLTIGDDNGSTTVFGTFQSKDPHL